MEYNDLQNAIVRAKTDLVNHPTLKAMASALEVPAQRLYSVAKQPIEGKEYNAKEYNWDAIQRFVGRRLEGKFADYDAFIEAAILADEQLKTSDGRRGGRSAGPKADDITLADGSVIPGRRTAIEVGQTVYMKQPGGVKEFQVVLLTETHACMQQVGTPILTSYSNWTLNQKMSLNAPAVASAEGVAEEGEEAPKGRRKKAEAVDA